MKKYYFVIISMTESGPMIDRVECQSLSDALRMLEMSDNTFYGEPDVSYHVEEHIIQCCN